MTSRLARRLSTTDAVFLGLGSMIGAGVFVVGGLAAASAGSGLLPALGIAGFVAFLNALTMAQLAAAFPESGGAYVYGRRLINPTVGFLAGWGFVIGKIASCSAMALTFAYYAFPDQPQIAASVAVLSLTLVNFFGVKKTAWVNKVLVGVVLLTLLIAMAGIWSGRDLDVNRLTGWTETGGVFGILQAAGLLFFAMAGYARIATMAEEVVEPRVTIPRAIVVALAITLVVYFLVQASLVLAVPMIELKSTTAPLITALPANSNLLLMVQIGAAIGALSVLLSLLAGVARTVFAMACQNDLPKIFSAVHPKYRVPHRAELIVGVIVAIIVANADLRLAIGFSSFAVLIYYFIANLAALRLPKEHRLYPKSWAALGVVMCLLLASQLPRASVVGGILLFAIGGLARWLGLRMQPTSSSR